MGMKKILMSAVVASVLLVGCSNDDQTDEVNELKQQVEILTAENNDLLNALQEEQEAFKEALGKEEVDDSVSHEPSSGDVSLFPTKEIDMYPETLLESSSLGEEGKEVELYINASRSDTGELHLDDGQNWLFVVKHGDKTYPLYEDYLQLGEIDYRVVKIDGKVGIIGIHTAHDDIYITQYMYDANEDAYVGESIYEVSNF